MSHCVSLTWLFAGPSWPTLADAMGRCPKSRKSSSKGLPKPVRMVRTTSCKKSCDKGKRLWICWSCVFWNLDKGILDPDFRESKGLGGFPSTNIKQMKKTVHFPFCWSESWAYEDHQTNLKTNREIHSRLAWRSWMYCWEMLIFVQVTALLVASGPKISLPKLFLWRCLQTKLWYISMDIYGIYIWYLNLPEFRHFTNQDQNLLI